MSMLDGEVRDVYVDKDGKLWRVMALTGEPIIRLQEIESKSPKTPVWIEAGISDFRWKDFKRIYRAESQS